MNPEELINMLIDYYNNLQRIQMASDKDKEIQNQLKVVKAKLESMGVVTTKFDIE